MVVIKEGIRQGGLTMRQNIIHVTYIPPDYATDPIATFAQQIAQNAIWIWSRET